MKKLVLLFLLASIGIGCKGQKGDRGEAGLQGARGASGSFELISGAVSNNAFTVSDSRLSTASQLTVYIGDAISLSELPYYLPASGVNTYFLFKPATDAVEIYNAQLAGASTYIIAFE